MKSYHLAPRLAPELIRREAQLSPKASSELGTSGVELRGFEPLTPSMRTQCATGQTAKVTAFAQVSDLRAVTITASDAV